jgi:hypothetical protein
MATLQQIAEKIDNLQGDMTFKRVMEKDFNYLTLGRRANREFVVRTNMRTLKSGPNRGKIRVDGVVVTMYGKRHRQISETRLIRRGENLLTTLDGMASILSLMNE